MSQRGRAHPRRYTRPPPQHEESPTDGPAWLASISDALGLELEVHERGGKHRPAPLDATLDLGEIAALNRTK